jgi:hypothetical protein
VLVLHNATRVISVVLDGFADAGALTCDLYGTAVPAPN